MDILVPINSIENVKPYADAGASEFYFGFYDNNWTNLFGAYSDINRMSGFGKAANMLDFLTSMTLADEVRVQGKRAFVTLNANTYSAKQIEYISNNYFPIFKEHKIDGVIVSNASMALAAVRYGLQPIASTMCGIYNSDIVDYYRRIGVRRMILPRDLMLMDIERIVEKNCDIEFEVFFMRNGCVFSDTYCLGLHRKECGSICNMVKNSNTGTISSYTSFSERHAIKLNNYLYNRFFHREACGMCALYRLMTSGVKALKIVGRADNCDSVLHDIERTKANIEIATSSKTEEEFLNNIRESSTCLLGLSCYYPEVRF